VYLDCFDYFSYFWSGVSWHSSMQSRIMENLQQKFIRSHLNLQFDSPKIKFEEYYNTYPQNYNRFFDTLMIQKEQQIINRLFGSMLQIILELFCFHYIIPILSLNVTSSFALFYI
jgi:hypothetical protein